ncbi:MAG TPA: hypothetical protein TECP_00076 [Hyphomicrobiaceae bacterium MAG_BT-2024]
MTPIEIGLAVSGALLIMVIIGVRVAFAAAIAGLTGLIWIFWSKHDYNPSKFFWALSIAGNIAGQVPHSKIASQALSLIPTFILIGYLAYYAGFTKSLFEAAKRWIGWLPGGLAVSTVFATAGFAAVSGASVATSAVFARVAIPEMLKLGYDKRFAAGVVASAGTLASLIPPSAILVIYAIIVEQDVGALLLAGFLPGLFSAFIYGGLVVSLALMFKNFGPPVRGFTLLQKLESLPGVFPIFFVIAIIILFIYNPTGGDAWGTPTEGGALGAFVVFTMAVTRGYWAGWQESLIGINNRLKCWLAGKSTDQLHGHTVKSRRIDLKKRATRSDRNDFKNTSKGLRAFLPRLTFFEPDPNGDPEVRGMRWPEFKSALLETARLSVMIFTIIWGVLIYVRFLGYADLPGAFADWISSLEQSPMLTLILILLAYAVLGMFMDAIGMLLLTLPVVYPAVMALNAGASAPDGIGTFGMNDVGCAIWFGIIVVKMAELCLITPPIGLNCFVVAGVQPNITVQDVFRGSSPFFVADALTIAGLIAFPSIVLYLPGRLLGF